MMRCQRVLQEFWERRVSPRWYIRRFSIGDHAMMETVNRQQNRVIDTIRGVCVPSRRSSMLSPVSETPSSENLDFTFHARSEKNSFEITTSLIL